MSDWEDLQEDLERTADRVADHVFHVYVSPPEREQSGKPAILVGVSFGVPVITVRELEKRWGQQFEFLKKIKAKAEKGLQSLKDEIRRAWGPRDIAVLHPISDKPHYTVLQVSLAYLPMENYPDWDPEDRERFFQYYQHFFISFRNGIVRSGLQPLLIRVGELPEAPQ